MGVRPVAVNGINGSTGGYLMPGATAGTISALARGTPPEVDPGHLAVLKRWRNWIVEKCLDVQQGIDPRDLAQAGWGVIFPFAGDEAARARQQEIIAALRPLLDLRRAQAGRARESYYREFTGPDAYRPGESKRDFLIRHKASPGSPADPRKLPYYLLIVADPEEIPYRFQYQIDVEYAVGRLHFDTVEEYARYAQGVVAAEAPTRPDAATAPRRATLFGVRNHDDYATQLSADHLIRPMAEILREQVAGGPGGGWDFASVLAEDATKARLGELLGGPATPAFLMTAGHGMGFSNADARQRAHQGALLCQDWQGPLRTPASRPIDEGCYFAADDVADSARLRGLVAFFFACYGAGTPQLDDFPDLALGGRDQIAPHSFLARLPQRLLGHPGGGALAVIGHVERAWGYSFRWPGAGEQLGAFQGMLVRLLGGYPVGAATEFLNQRYAAMSVELGEALAEEKFGRVDDDNLAGLWISNNDARSYVIVGDPAVRVGGATGPAAAGPPRPAPAVVATPPGEPAPTGPFAASPPPPPSPAVAIPEPGPAATAADDPFADVPVIGRMTAAAAALKLRSVGEDAAAAALAGPNAVPPGRTPRPWEHTAHALGFLPPGGPGTAGGMVPIRDAGGIEADPTLAGAAIEITLDAMRVAAYPGGGMHRVLFAFGAQDRTAGRVEDLHFNATCRVRDGQEAGVVGRPVFVGLNVGPGGLAFRCYTIAVRDEGDLGLLDALEAGPFEQGLRLLAAAQPAIGLLSGMAVGVTRAVARRARNIPVQDVVLNLDFGTSRARARLAEGSYVAVQVPDGEHVAWDWSAWAFDAASGRVVAGNDPTATIPYNYFVFGIGRCEPPTPT